MLIQPECRYRRLFNSQRDVPYSTNPAEMILYDLDSFHVADGSVYDCGRYFYPQDADKLRQGTLVCTCDSVRSRLAADVVRCGVTDALDCDVCAIPHLLVNKRRSRNTKRK